MLFIRKELLMPLYALWAVMLLVMLPFSLQAATDESQVVSAAGVTAEAAVNTYISDLLVKMGTIRSLYESNKEDYFSRVDGILAEFVDFREVARGVMAKYGTGPNGASASQLDRFAEVFRASLIDFYGSALATYGGVEFDILDTRTPPRDPENASNVRMSIKSDDGSRFEVQYTMFLNEERSWKLKNLYVEGVNLRRQYYSRFDNMMSRNNYNIDAVIDSWQLEE